MKFIAITKPDGTTIKVSEARLADPAVAAHYGISIPEPELVASDATAPVVAEPSGDGDAESDDNSAPVEPVVAEKPTPKPRARKA